MRFLFSILFILLAQGVHCQSPIYRIYSRCHCNSVLNLFARNVNDDIVLFSNGIYIHSDMSIEEYGRFELVKDSISFAFDSIFRIDSKNGQKTKLNFPKNIKKNKITEDYIEKGVQYCGSDKIHRWCYCRIKKIRK
jgi:hypothetical protein